MTEVEKKLYWNEDTMENGFGFQTRKRWDSVQDFLLDFELLEAKIDLDQLYTNKFLPKLKKRD